MILESIFDVSEVKKCSGYQQLAGRVLKDIKIFDELIVFGDINTFNCSKNCNNFGQLIIDDYLQYETIKINKIWTYGHYFDCLAAGISAIIYCNNTRLDLTDSVLFKRTNKNEAMYHRLIYSLKQCGKFLIKSTDEIIEMNIFENFDVSMINDVSDDNLEVFVANGWINEEAKEKCIELRNLYIDIKVNHPQIWNSKGVKTSELWGEILDLAEKIKWLLY